MQKHCSHCTSVWGDITCREITVKKVSFKFLMSTVSLMTSLLTEDCSRFLPPQHRTLDHRLFEDVSVAQQGPLMTQNANVVDLEDRRHGAGCHSDTSGQDPSDTEMPVLPA